MKLGRKATTWYVFPRRLRRLLGGGGGVRSDTAVHDQIQKTKSWYGSLSRKSTASLSIQKETIAGSPLKAGSTPDFHRYDLKKNDDTASVSGTSQQDSPGAKTEILPHDHDRTGDPPENTNQDGQAVTQGTTTQDSTDTAMPDAPPAAEPAQKPTPSSGWLGGWFGRVPATTTEKPEDTQNASKVPEVPAEPPGPPQEPVQEAVAPTQTTDEQSAPPNEQRPASYWFNFWSGQSAPEGDRQEPVEASEPQPTTPNQVDVPVEEAPPADPDPYSKPSAGSTWAFWSRDQPKAAGKQPQTPETGELAVVGERSERHPKRANSTDMSRETAAKQEPLTKAQQTEGAKSSSSSKATKKGKKKKPQSINVETTPRPQTPQSDTASVAADSPSRPKNKAPGTATKPAPPNLLLPSFRGTYRMKENPSILKQITSLLLRTKQPPTKHVFLSQEPPKIKKALAIGVHGLFPAAYRMSSASSFSDAGVLLTVSPSSSPNWSTNRNLDEVCQPVRRRHPTMG